MDENEGGVPLLTCRHDERAVISASNKPSGGAGSGGGGMEALEAFVAPSLGGAGPGPGGAFPATEVGLRMGRGLGGIGEDESKRGADTRDCGQVACGYA